MYDSHRITLACGTVGDNCDSALGAAADGVPNFRDLDSDNDGLTDREEREANTDPCTADTDADGASDLVERAAMSNPRDRASGPPSNALYVVLPYYPAPMMGTHEFREFTFSTRIRQADVFFLVDNSASMEPVIDNLRTNLRSVIVPGIRAQIPDIQMGVGSFDSMPVPPQGCPGAAGPATTSMRCTQSPTTAGDYALWIRQRVTSDITAVQGAFDAMRTIDQDTMGAFVGGDLPECQTEAAFEVVEGTGVLGHETDALALRSVRNARDAMGNGWVPRRRRRARLRIDGAPPRATAGAASTRAASRSWCSPPTRAGTTAATRPRRSRRATPRTTAPSSLRRTTAAARSLSASTWATASRGARTATPRSSLA